MIEVNYLRNSIIFLLGYFNRCIGSTPSVSFSDNTKVTFIGNKAKRDLVMNLQLHSELTTTKLWSRDSPSKICTGEVI